LRLQPRRIGHRYLRVQLRHAARRARRWRPRRRRGPLRDRGDAVLRLTRRRRRRRGERGAVTTLVAVLLAGNVLLGMAALALDVGLYYVEREELQSGAD